MIYFDNNATTPIIPEVKEVMAEAMDMFWGNPSSGHAVGNAAAKALAEARETLADLLAVNPDELYFTSGGTESDNLAIFGIMEQIKGCGEVLLSSIEHPAVRSAAEKVTEPTCMVYHCVPVDSDGIVDIKELQAAINEKVKLISIMFANNEIGTIQPVNVIGEIAREHGIPFHSDAVQAFGKMPLHIQENNIALVSISSHKIYGPKGCGALYVRKDCQLVPRTFGGGQEHGIRNGTENIPAILGFVKAAEIAYQKMGEETIRLGTLTDYLYKAIVSTIDNCVRNGHPEKHIPGTLNVSFPGTTSEMIVEELDKEGICVSGGAACHTGEAAPSAVLLACGKRKQDAVSAIRFSLGRFNTREEVDTLVAALKKTVEKLRLNNA